MSHSLSDALFSGTKQRVLGILYGQPARSFYANELIGLRSPRKELLGHLLACCTSVKTVRLLLAVTPAVFDGDIFAMKGGTAINLFIQTPDSTSHQALPPRCNHLAEVSG